jgi:VWFA-related protein
VDRARFVAPASFAGVRERNIIRNAYGGLATGFGQAHVAPAELSGVPECRSSQDEVVRRLELLDSRLIEAFESLERDEQGFATTHALLALIGALQPLPGRKAILLFSEGLAIPADVEASFLSVVAAANRASVSIYAADAGGLHAASAADETRRTIDSLHTRLQLQNDGMGNPLTRGASTHDPGTSGLALLERNEDTLRLAPGSGLGRLADQTGGFLIQDTNDLSCGLAEMDEELGAYYLLSYAPKRQVYDYPNLGQPLRREEGRPLTFFVTAWPALERPEIDARLEVVHDGQSVAATRTTGLRPGADGRIQLASSLPLERFPPGAYELRLTLTDGKDEETRTAAVPIAP